MEISPFKKSVDEISASLALRCFGITLLLTIVGAGLSFINRTIYKPFLGPSLAVCWPFQPLCHDLPFGEVSRPFLGFLLVALGFAAIPLFLKASRVRFGLLALAALSILKWTVIFSDFVFMGNYHYICLVMTLIYLFVPGKKELLQLTMIAIYMSSSFLKYNNEWLSGASLLHPQIFIAKFGLVPLYLGAVLEGVVSWLLLSVYRPFRYFALLVMTAFHLSSIEQVGFYFPVIMICLLSIFVFVDLDPEPTPILDRVFAARLRRPTVVILSLFALAQILPRFAARDWAMSGVIRLPALNMLDARLECRASLMVKSGGTYEHITSPVLLKTVRTACDPIHYLERARRLCAEGAESVSLHLRSRRTTDTSFTEVLSVADACKTSYPLSFAELFSRQRGGQ